MTQKIEHAPRESFISAMRQVASAVTVVTTDGPAGRHGSTVSAFSSVSADPPTVLVCLRGNSRISDLVRNNGCFTVNVLPEGSSRLARIFAGEFDRDQIDRFQGLQLGEFPGHAPSLPSATYFVCKLVNAVRQGTHEICFGEVMDVGHSNQMPLTYHDGAYRRLQMERVPEMS